MDIAHGTRVTAWLLAATLVVVPLVVDPWGFAQFGPLKWASVSILAAATAAHLLARRRVDVPRSWGIGWLVFLVWGVVVSVAAVDPVYTWIGTPDRHLGLFAWACFSVCFFAATTLADDADVRLILRSAVVALGGIGIYVLFEWAGFAPVDLATGSGRPGGPFGTPAYLGAACALLVPVVIGAAVDGIGSRAWRRAAIVAGALGGFASLASQTRAGWVGLAAAVVVAWPAIGRWVTAHRMIVIGGVTLVALAVVVTPLADRVTSALDFEAGGARGRIDEWNVGAAVLSRHPATGLGFEGYRIGFAEGVDAEYERRYGRAFTPDRAHSGFLDVAVTTGVPGAIVYTVGGVALVVAAIRVIRRRIPWLTGVAAGVVAYVVQQQFLFPLAEVDGLFWVFAGLLVAAAPHRTVEVAILRGAWVPVLVIVGAVAAAGVLDVAADHHTRRALDLERAGRRTDAVALADDAVGLRPDSIRYAYVAAAISSRAGTGDGLLDARAFIDDALDVSPRDPVLLAAHAGYLLDLARERRDPALLTAAIGEWEMLVARDPHHAQYRLELGVAYAVAGRISVAEEEWRVAADLAPSSGAPWANLASLYLDQGDIAAAESALRELVARDPDSGLIEPLQNQIDRIERDNG